MREAGEPKPVSHRLGPQKPPRFTVTKYFSHANWASAGERVKDGDVTERVNSRGGSVAQLLDGTVEVVLVV